MKVLMMIVMFKNKKMIIFSSKKMKAMKTNIYHPNYIKTYMMKKNNKTICKTIKIIILKHSKKKILLKFLLKDNGKQKD